VRKRSRNRIVAFIVTFMMFVSSFPMAMHADDAVLNLPPAYENGYDYLDCCEYDYENGDKENGYDDYDYDYDYADCCAADYVSNEDYAELDDEDSVADCCAIINDSGFAPWDESVVTVSPLFDPGAGFEQVGALIDFEGMTPGEAPTIGVITGSLGQARSRMQVYEFAGNNVLRATPPQGSTNRFTWSLPLNGGNWEVDSDSDLITFNFCWWPDVARPGGNSLDIVFNSSLAGAAAAASNTGRIFTLRASGGSANIYHLPTIGYYVGTAVTSNPSGPAGGAANLNIAFATVPLGTHFNVTVNFDTIMRTVQFTMNQILPTDAPYDAVALTYTSDFIYIPAAVLAGGINAMQMYVMAAGGQNWARNGADQPAAWDAANREATYGARLDNITIWEQSTGRTAIYPIRVDLSATSFDLQFGAGGNPEFFERTVTATVFPAHADNINVLWSVYPAGVVTIYQAVGSNAVVITTAGAGEAVVTATALLYPVGGTAVYAEVEISVTAPDVTFVEEITFGTFNPNILVGAQSNGASRAFSVQSFIYPENATLTTVTWSAYPAGLVNLVPSGPGGRAVNIIGQTAAGLGTIVSDIEVGQVRTVRITATTVMYGEAGEQISEYFYVTIRRQDVFADPVPDLEALFTTLQVDIPFAQWTHRYGNNFTATGTGAAARWLFPTVGGVTVGGVNFRDFVTHEMTNIGLQMSGGGSGQRNSNAALPTALAGNQNVFFTMDWRPGRIDNRCHSGNFDPNLNDGAGGWVLANADQNAIDFRFMNGGDFVLTLTVGYDNEWPSARCVCADASGAACTCAPVCSRANCNGGAVSPTNHDRREPLATRTAGVFADEIMGNFMDRFDDPGFFKFYNMMALENWAYRWYTVGIDFDFLLGIATVIIVESGSNEILERIEVPFSEQQITGMGINGRRTPANDMALSYNGFDNMHFFAIPLADYVIIDFLPPDSIPQQFDPADTGFRGTPSRTLWQNWFKQFYVEDVSNVSDLNLPTEIDVITNDGSVVTVQISGWEVYVMPWMTHATLADRLEANNGQHYFDPTMRGVHGFRGTVVSIPETAENQMVRLAPRIYVELRYYAPRTTYARPVEWLDRGLVAAPARTDASILAATNAGRTHLGMLVQWRISAFEYSLPEADWLTFNVFRNGSRTPLNAEPITSLNFVDRAGQPGDTYILHVIQNGNVIEVAGPVTAWANNWLDIPVQRPTAHQNTAHQIWNEHGVPNSAFVAGTHDGTESVVNTISYVMRDMSVADIDGDGRYEVLVRWESNAQRDSGLTPRHTGYTIFDLYWFNPDDGTSGLIWRINMGLNIVSSRHHSPFMFFDLTNSGFADFAVKTADGTRVYHPEPDGTILETRDGGTPVYIIGGDGSQNITPDRPTPFNYTTLNPASGYRYIWVGGTPAADTVVNMPYYGLWTMRGSSHTVGRISDGPEFLTVFCGRTGIPLATANYAWAYDVNRGAWGDNWNNRSDRYFAAVAFMPKGGIEGAEPWPTIIDVRSYYAPGFVAATQFIDGELIEIWQWIKGEWSIGGWAERVNRGNHSLTMADVTGTGYDAVIFGSVAVDHRGYTLWEADGSRGTIVAVHGDALHMSRIFPPHISNEFYRFSPHEASAPGNVSLFNAATGRPVWTFNSTSNDVGRGVMANITPSPGFEMWASAGTPVHNALTGNQASIRTGATGDLHPGLNVQARIYWTGNLLSELLDGATINRATFTADNQIIGQTSVQALTGQTFSIECGLIADILGDWREEIITPLSNQTAFRINITDFPTEHVIHTLMHDPTYRMAVSWQNVVYNQPPHLGFYLGEDIRDTVAARALPTGTNLEYTRIPERAPVLLLEMFDATVHTYANQAIVELVMLGNPGIADMQMRLVVPYYLTLASYTLANAGLEAGFTSPTATSPYFGWTLPDNMVDFGTLITFTFDIAPDAPLNTLFPVSVEFEEIPTNDDDVPLVNRGILDATVHIVLPGFLGDANDDGIVMSADATMLARFLANQNGVPGHDGVVVNPYLLQLADPALRLPGNTVCLADLSALVNWMLNRGMPWSYYHIWQHAPSDALLSN